MRIRYYGFFANRHRAEKIELARILLSDQTSSAQTKPKAPSLRNLNRTPPVNR